MNKKIKIAFVKYNGLSTGGSEKLLQIIAANLPKNEFEVDYYYCGPAVLIGEPLSDSLNTDAYRVEYMQNSGVNLIKFNVGAVDHRKYTLPWVNTDFWLYFDEGDYDIIQTCRAGHKEYPFNKIRHAPIVDIIALSSGSDNQYNIARVMHICQWSADRWVKRGGDKNRVALISLPIDIKDKIYPTLRQELGLKGKFVYGFHQRSDNNIFSPIPLLAYKQIENENTAFVLLGGGDTYKKQAKDLNIKNINFLPATGDQEAICVFLNTLNVFAHGRKDGEVNSQAMAEAMYFGLPIVSHLSEYNNGHVECIGDAGAVLKTVSEYAQELLKLQNNNEYYSFRSRNSKKRFLEKYELGGQIKNITGIYRDVYNNPFPHKFFRILSKLHYTQNIRILCVKMYLFFKYYLHIDLLKIIKSPND